MSTATDHAIREVDLSWLRGKKTFVEDKYFESYDKGYVVSSIRQHLSEAGALLVQTTNADTIIEIRSGALSVNNKTNLFGVPSMVLPIPLSGPASTPELAIYKSIKADAIGKFALFAYVKDTGEHIQAMGPFSGYAHYRLVKILGIGWKHTDIPELKKKHGK